MGRFDDFAGRIDRPQHIGHMAQGHQAGPGTQQGPIGGHVQLAIIQHRHKFQHHAPTCPQKVPGHDIGVVFHHRQDDLIACAQALAKAGSDQIDRLNHSPGLLRRGCAIEIDQGPVIDLARQDRKFFANNGDIKGHQTLLPLP